MSVKLSRQRSGPLLQVLLVLFCGLLYAALIPGPLLGQGLLYPEESITDLRAAPADDVQAQHRRKDDHEPDQDSEQGTLSLPLAGFGTLVIQPLRATGSGFLLKLAKPGGQSEVLVSLEGLTADRLFQLDLDGDHKPEIVLLAMNTRSHELFPFVFRNNAEFTRLHPAILGESPISGESINIISTASGAALCVKFPFHVHDFGAPELIRQEHYRILDGVLTKVSDQTEQPEHFNQMANWGGLAYHDGDYLVALQRYEAALNMVSAATPSDHCAEVRFFLAQCRKFLKDFTGAGIDFQNVVLTCPDGEYTERAQREFEFITGNIQNREALSLHVDTSALMCQGKHQEALQFLDLNLERTGGSTMRDHLLFQKGEALLALGRFDDAIDLLRAILQDFPDSSIRPDVEDRLQELEGDPDEPDNL